MCSWNTVYRSLNENEGLHLLITIVSVQRGALAGNDKEISSY